jgi:hypothetical protein
VTITRGYQGSTARVHGVNKWLWEQEDSLMTDANGQNALRYVEVSANYTDDGVYDSMTYYTPFRLIIRKSGHKTLDQKLPIGRGTQYTYKDEKVLCSFDLKPYRFREEKSV